MALTQIQGFELWKGLSGDDKSSITTEGAIIYYTDTKVREINTGGVWSEYVLNYTVRTEDVIFHDAVVAPATSTVFEVGAYKILTLEIYGTSATRTITFNYKGESGTLRLISGVKLSDFSMGTGTTGSGEVWQFDISAFKYFVVDLTAVAGGNVSVKGRVTE